MKEREARDLEKDKEEAKKPVKACAVGLLTYVVPCTSILLATLREPCRMNRGLRSVKQGKVTIYTQTLHCH